MAETTGVGATAVASAAPARYTAIRCRALPSVVVDDTEDVGGSAERGRRVDVTATSPEVPGTVSVLARVHFLRGLPGGRTAYTPKQRGGETQKKTAGRGNAEEV